VSVSIVTDSTSDLDPKTARRLGITVVPLTVRFGDQAYLDGVTMTSEEFFARLVASKELPKTSQPSPAQFAEAYRRLSLETDTILSIHISAKLSGTLQSATIAAEEVRDRVRVEMLDSESASLGLAPVVIAAAQVAQAGVSLAGVLEAARYAMSRTRVIVMVETLEYLQKGGRIGRARAFLGGLLNVKPLLQVADGEVSPLERVRSRQKALDRMVQIVLETPDLKRVVVGHAVTPNDARAMLERVRAARPDVELEEAYLGPVIGVYTGPGAIGAVMLRS
jgi:DegV family protein with EDD domain